LNSTSTIVSHRIVSERLVGSLVFGEPDNVAETEEFVPYF